MSSQLREELNRGRARLQDRERRDRGFFFDAAFLLFHRVFFPQGNFTFDPGTQRLVQLFPEQFWTETAIGIAAVGLVLAIVVTLLARRRAAQLGG